jgi:hypothetical protein
MIDIEKPENNLLGFSTDHITVKPKGGTMAEDDIDNKGASINAWPPFTFGIGLQGELIIGFVGGYLPPDGKPLRLHLSVPTAELPTLIRGLNESKDIRDLLSATPSTESTQ